MGNGHLRWKNMFSGSLLEHPIANFEKPSPLSANDVSLILGIHHGDKWWYSWLDSWTSLGNPSKYALIYYHFRNMKEHQKKTHPKKHPKTRPVNHQHPPTAAFPPAFPPLRCQRSWVDHRSGPAAQRSSCGTRPAAPPPPNRRCQQKLGHEKRAQKNRGKIWEYLMGISEYGTMSLNW